MLNLLAGFIQQLRAAGLPISLTENLDAVQAVSHIPLDDRQAFKYALAATLVKSDAHWRAFETVFEVYFSLRGPEFALAEADADAPAWSPGGPPVADDQLDAEQLPRCCTARCLTTTRPG